VSGPRTRLPLARAAASAAVCVVAVAALALPARAQTAAALERCGADEAAEACLRRALDVAPAVRDAGGGGAARLRGAIELLRDVCERGIGDGCYFAGRLILTSIPERADSVQFGKAQDEAAGLFRAGCDPRRSARPSGGACDSAGDAFAFGLGAVTPDADSAYAYYQRGCALGNATACSREAAHLAERPEHGPDRAAMAEEHATAACREKSASGCVQAAAARLERLRRLSPGRRATERRTEAAAALGELRDYCREGEGLLAACTTLGAAYADAPAGVAASADSARRYYLLGCRGRGGGERDGEWLGDGAACRGAAGLALAASPPDTTRAMRFYILGCVLFDADACAGQGRLLPLALEPAGEAYRRLILYATACVAARPSSAGCHAAGESFETELSDTVRARAFYTLACRRGDAAGCGAAARLAAGYADGVKFYRLGCVLRGAAACLGLAEALQEGFGDATRAGALTERACELGSAEGCWSAMLVLSQARVPGPGGARDLDRQEREGWYRAAACRLDRSYCKRR
jgi:hypothetical protein